PCTVNTAMMKYHDQMSKFDDDSGKWTLIHGDDD
ncbi:hypothetical protein Lpp27_01860, partial [Lacticaseibacillus paracasei subsp. paracasei CNCM I-4648]